MFPIVEVTGTARERGRLHGSKARERIDRSVATYARLFAYCGIDWKGAQKLGAGYRDVIGTLNPALLEEIEGIAAGSGRHVNEILARQSRPCGCGLRGRHDGPPGLIDANARRGRSRARFTEHPAILVLDPGAAAGSAAVDPEIRGTVCSHRKLTRGFRSGSPGSCCT